MNWMGLTNYLTKQRTKQVFLGYLRNRIGASKRSALMPDIPLYSYSWYELLGVSCDVTHLLGLGGNRIWDCIAWLLTKRLLWLRLWSFLSVAAPPCPAFCFLLLHPMAPSSYRTKFYYWRASAYHMPYVDKCLWASGVRLSFHLCLSQCGVKWICR